MAAIHELQERLQSLHDDALSIRATAEAEKRDLNPDEVKSLDNVFAEFETVQGQIERFARLEANHRMLSTPGQRRTEPDNPADRANEDSAGTTPQAKSPEPRANGGDRTRVSYVNPATRLAPHERGNWGWKGGLGEFAIGVAKASMPGGYIDPRLDIRGQPSLYGSEGTNADGGFSVPPDFREAIRSNLSGVDSLLARTDQLVTGTNQVTIPVDETAPWESSSPTTGIQGFWTAEAGKKLQSKPSLNQVVVALNKLAILVPVTDELLEDAPAIETFLRRKAAEKIVWMINYAIIRGTGTGQPRGILAAANTALVTVAPSSGQTVNTVTYDNILDMWVRMPAEFRANAVWLVHQSVEAQLLRMRFDTASTVPIPVYLPGGDNAAAAPFGTLLGRPVIPNQMMPALGTAGDVVLADLSQYLTVTKGGGGVRSDVSIHLYFDYDVTTFRFVFRIGGRPWWTYPTLPAAGTLTLSPFVSLGSRAT